MLRFFGGTANLRRRHGIRYYTTLLPPDRLGGWELCSVHRHMRALCASPYNRFPKCSPSVLDANQRHDIPSKGIALPTQYTHSPPRYRAETNEPEIRPPNVTTQRIFCQIYSCASWFSRTLRRVRVFPRELHRFSRLLSQLPPHPPTPRTRYNPLLCSRRVLSFFPFTPLLDFFFQFFFFFIN